MSRKIFVRAWVPNDTRLKTKSGSDFTTSELPDIVATRRKTFGVRTDQNLPELQFNIGGQMYQVSMVTLT